MLIRFFSLRRQRCRRDGVSGVMRELVVAAAGGSDVRYRELPSWETRRAPIIPGPGEVDILEQRAPLCVAVPIIPALASSSLPICKSDQLGSRAILLSDHQILLFPVDRSH